MFRITFMVEDKRLAEVLRGLDGKVVEMEPPVPVTFEGQRHNAALGLGRALPERDFVPGLGAKPGKRMSITDMRNFTKKGDKLGSAGIKDICVKLGWSSNSFSYAVHKAMKAKVLRRVAVGEYEVI